MYFEVESENSETTRSGEVLIIEPRRLHERHSCKYTTFKNALVIHEQNPKEIIAVKESLYVIKHAWIFTKLFASTSRLKQHLY